MKGWMCVGDAEKTTLRLIHSAAMQEFLEKDFASASLRNIVKKAGVTTGAFYGYYASKENLFEALVCKQYEHFIALFRKAQQDFANIPQEEQPKHLAIYPALAWRKCFCMPTSI